MKKLLLTTLLLTSTTAFAQNITFAMEATYPPFESTNVKGEIVGFDVDIAKAICKQIDATCSFKNEPFDALIPSLIRHRGGFDAAISAIDITPARARKVAFSIPYYTGGAAFIGNKADETMAQVKNVGVQNGTTYQQYIENQGDRYNMKSYASIQDAILDLTTGRIDAVFGDASTLGDAVKAQKGLHFIGDKVTDPKYFGHGFAIAVNKNNTALLEQLNKGITQIKANGEYQKIYNQWFK
ncbi:transporter substrate-binding domain-containing protein [Actinobacillus delphinicola]|uniref:Amino acid ABC transporter periplasmic protein n=1 Tax=Actinobacillus delphinicola TaxID=51161 RepID=A0A448TRK3_9PAST|nr:transporter substrate-binding domain-containing protein [Actinobacillus delphinicola]VEJ08629.1 amino acid ABC transporter periplasmic protein [Actinobacillus delphinicola]